MQKCYTTGEFAKRAKVTIRTIRYYDKKGILQPSFRNDAGYRMYTDQDFLKLQKVLSLKYLGFSLEEIKNMTTMMYQILQNRFRCRRTCFIKKQSI